jgi:hypothetical protein
MRKSKSMVVACFLPGRAKDLSAPQYLAIRDLFLPDYLHVLLCNKDETYFSAALLTVYR